MFISFNEMKKVTEYEMNNLVHTLNIQNKKDNMKNSIWIKIVFEYVICKISG